MTGTLIRANGIELAYDEFGERGHPSILLIMGLGTQMIAWPEAFCRGLADRGFHVIRFDNRDIGLSEKIEGRPQPGVLLMVLASTLGLPIRTPYTLDDMAADAVGLLDELGINTAHIVGASMGGMIAQLLAAHYPQRCLSLTSIMSSSGRRRLPRARPEITRQMLSRPANDDHEARIAHIMRTYQLIGSPGYPVDPADLRTRVEVAYSRSSYPHGYMRQFSAIAASGSRVRQLQRIKAPTLVLHGQDDPLIPAAHGIDTARWIPNAQLKIIKGWGHDLPTPLLPTLTDLIGAHARGVNRETQAE